jgi:CysZ protein
MQGSPAQALNYLIEGAQLISRPGFRRFIFIPLLVNLVIFIGVTIALFYAFQDFFTLVVGWTPSWLAWLTWLLWPLVGFIFLMIYGYSFNLITNFIAAPFYGLLAEKIESHLTASAPPSEPWDQLIPRTIKREVTKLWYFMSRGFLVLLVFIALFFVPGANLLGAIIALIWGCWCMAVQYLDYPADNHHLEFRALRRRLNQQPLTSYSLGGAVLLGSMIPLVNIVVTPIAVAGASIYWVREISKLPD